jgi:hypothetical protein
MNVLRILGKFNSGLLVEKGSQNPSKKENVSSGEENQECHYLHRVLDAAIQNTSIYSAHL